MCNTGFCVHERYAWGCADTFCERGRSPCPMEEEEEREAEASVSGVCRADRRKSARRAPRKRRIALLYAERRLAADLP